jgi:DNA polymerase-3 subunit epsilon
MIQPFRRLKLQRPLAFVDLETTGTDPLADRIVEVAVLTFSPGQEPPARFLRLVNTGVPIPRAATALHGITDRDVVRKPTFAHVAPRLARHLDGADLAGFNLRRFDLPFLAAEFRRAGVALDLTGRAILDPLQLFHAREPRDLAAALRFYCGCEHHEAHSA